MAAINMPRALEGIRVLDFTRMYAGPFCTMLLSELGAEVIKVEFQGSGDAARTIPPMTEGGEGYIFVILNRGKESVTLDLKSVEGQSLARDLVRKVDVLVENFTPGVMDRLNLGYEQVKDINQKLIYASLSGFGHTGPYKSKPAYDLIAQAMGGLMGVTGFSDKPPTKTGPSMADFIGALYTTISILAAMKHRDETGEGQEINTSLQDCIWAIASIEYSPHYFLKGEVPKRGGNELPNVVPWNTYNASDGYVVIPIVTVGQWENFAKLMGREDLLGDPESMTLTERVKRRDEINAAVSEWTQGKTVAEIIKEMGDAHLPCSSIPTIDTLVSDPQLLSREMIVDIEQPISGKMRVPGSTFKLSKTPGKAGSPAPFLGEHNFEAFSRILGYDEERIRALMSKGII